MGDPRMSEKPNRRAGDRPKPPAAEPHGEPPPDDPTAPPSRRPAEAPSTPMDAPAPALKPAPAPDPLSGWSRPLPVRQDSNVRAWLYFLAGICLLVAAWVPFRAIYQRTRFKPLEAGVRDADTFIALAYGGVSAGTVQGPEEVSRPQFAQHIRALRENGFNPIGLSDVSEFYRNGKPLPRKAVLITLEQGKKSSYLETRDILRENRWRATMFVRADTIRDKDPSALRWPILRDMARSGTWDVGAESVDGFRRIPAGPDGETGNFLSSPRWIETEQRLETLPEFEARIQGEHRRMAEVFAAEMEAPPLAYAFPYGDYGQYDPRAVSTRVLNLSEVGKTFGIGFSLGPFLLNTRYSDPRALNRLLVNPDWSPEQFLSIVESGRAVPPWKISRPLEAARWLTDWGMTEHPADGSLWLKAVPRGTNSADHPPTTGALSWLVGSDLFGDFTARIRFRVAEGQFGIRLRSRSGGEEGIRILFDADGNCWVNQKVYGAEEFTQAVAQDVRTPSGAERELEISMDGRNLFAMLDGRMLLKEPLDLMGGQQPGLFGLEVWDPAEGVAAAQVLALEFPRPRQVLMDWPASEAFTPAYLMKALNRDTYRLAAISPPWMDVVRAIPLVLPKWDDRTLQTFARMRGVPVLPRITLRSAALALQIPADLPGLEAEALGVDGAHLDCRQVAQEDIPVLVPWLQSVHQHVKEKNMKLAMQFPPGVAKLASFASIAALFPGALIAVESDARAEELAPTVPDVLVSESLPPPPAADMHLNLYYQLATRALPSEALSPQARQEADRREGYLAYQEGEYEKAIERWERWLAEDPQSAEAMSLIGKAYVQKGDLTRALEYYTRSLEASPGQIQMAIRRSELLGKLDREDEAREQLNLYARIFPENPDILIAQAQWLDRRKRRLEAREMLETLVRESPMNLQARVALLNLQDDPAERHRTMRGILDLGRSPDSQIPFGHSLLNMEMLTFPESGVFFEYLRAQARRGQGTKQRDLYESFLPLTNRVTDDFASGRLSDGWIASGGIRALDRGRYELRAAIDQAETYLRLRRSELMRDGYLEVVLDESQGFFWIYARRSSHTMVRFGFDQDGFIHLQVWNEGEMVSHQTRPWIRPPGSMTLRMEVRGDGARGFVNGLEIFDAPVEIPPVVAYGWWGIAPFAFDLGVARARIIRMDCEPLPPVIALVPPGDPERQVVELRRHVGGISALVPAWVFQNPDGTLPEGLPENAGIFRMFTAFHRMRLLPAIDLSYEGDIDPERVVEFIRRNHLPGVVLKRRTSPPRKWQEALTAALEGHPATVIVLQTEAALWNTPGAGEESRGELVVRPEAGDHLLPRPGEKIEIREMPVGSALIPPLRGDWKVALHAPDAPPEGESADLVSPRLYLTDADGRASIPPAP